MPEPVAVCPECLSGVVGPGANDGCYYCFKCAMHMSGDAGPSRVYTAAQDAAVRAVLECAATAPPCSILPVDLFLRLHRLRAAMARNTLFHGDIIGPGEARAMAENERSDAPSAEPGSADEECEHNILNRNDDPNHEGPPYFCQACGDYIDVTARAEPGSAAMGE